MRRSYGRVPHRVFSWVNDCVNERNEWRYAPGNGAPNTTQQGRLQWQVHRIWRPKTLFQIPALPFMFHEVWEKPLASYLSNKGNIHCNSQITIIIKCDKSDIQIVCANGITEKAVEITFKSVPSILSQYILSYKYKVHYTYVLTIWVNVYRERLIISRMITLPLVL